MTACSAEHYGTCAQFIGERTVALDDLSPSAARSLLRVLWDCFQLTVNVTSREKRGWREADRLHEVGPPDWQDASAVFPTLFTVLDEAPLHGPVVATYAQADLATGFWHVRAEKRAGVGHAGIGTASAPVSGIRMRGSGEPYPHDALDHRFISVDASEVFVRRRGWSGAHSDHIRPESAHLLLSLADHAR